MAKRTRHSTYYGNGIPFYDILNPISDQDHTLKESANRPNYLPTVANQLSPQTTAHSIQMKEGISLGPRDEKPSMVNSSMQSARTTDHVSETSNKKKKKSTKQKKRFHKLLGLGVPGEEAETLCKIPWDVLDQMPYIKKLLERQNAIEQAAVNIAPVLTNNIATKPSLLDILRVGIRNSLPMNENQMKMVHRHLIIAITEQYTDGGGPEFIGFTLKSGWILVTCSNQRSKDWLVREVPYLEPWPGAQLSVIPEKELPKPPRGITFIPKSEAASVQEALDLIKAQNKDLNTELWRLLSEKEEVAGKAITLYLDEPSAETLKAQEYKAAIGFTMMTFKFKGINRPYAGYTTNVSQNIASATPNQGIKPGHSSKWQGSQSYSDKPAQGTGTTSNQSGGGPLFSIAKSFSTAEAIEVQSMSHPSAGRNRNPFTQSIKPPSLAAKGQVLTMGVLAAQPITQNPQSFSKSRVAQNRSQGGIVIERDGCTFPARRLIPVAVKERDGSWQISQSQGKRTALSQDKNSSQVSAGRVTRHKDGSSDGGGPAIARDKCITVSTPQFTGGFGGPPIIQNSLNKIDLLSQSRNADPDIRNPGHNGYLSLTDTCRLNQSSELSTHGVTFDNNRMRGGDVISATKSGFGGRPRASLLGNTFGQDKITHWSSIFDHDSALPTNHASKGQMFQPNVHAQCSENTFYQNRNETNLTVLDIEESSEDGQSAEEEGGYSTWIIEEPQCYGTRLMLEGAVSTGTLHSANSAMSLSYVEPQNHNGNQLVQSRKTATLDRGLLPHPNNYYSVHDLDIHGAPCQDGKIAEDRDFRSNKGLLPHPKNSYGGYGTQNHGSKNHGNPLQEDTGTKSNREFGSNKGLLPHSKESYSTQTYSFESHGEPVQDSRVTIDRDFTSNCGLLPHPIYNYGSKHNPESFGGPNSRETEDNQGIMSKGVLSKSRESHYAQIQNSNIRGRTFHDREAVNDRDSRLGVGGLLPHPKEEERPFQGSKESETGRKSRSDKRLSPRTRGGYDVHSRDGRHDRPRSRSPQEKRACIKKPNDHGKLSQNRKDREFRPHRRISPRRKSEGRGRPVLDRSGRWDDFQD